MPSSTCARCGTRRYARQRSSWAPPSMSRPPPRSPRAASAPACSTPGATARCPGPSRPPSAARGRAARGRWPPSPRPSTTTAPYGRRSGPSPCSATRPCTWRAAGVVAARPSPRHRRRRGGVARRRARGRHRLHAAVTAVALPRRDDRQPRAPAHRDRPARGCEPMGGLVRRDRGRDVERQHARARDVAAHGAARPARLPRRADGHIPQAGSTKRVGESDELAR